jgi:redox-sensitive bicupin YhaK (pirin superfamily)
MYHGDVVPGFPQHPHWGFETVTMVRQGFVDHSDSLGATARIGPGDVQWMTAGGGIVHSEMFPLVHRDRPNPTELFQLWLNLPHAAKHVPAHFTMFWEAAVPRATERDSDGRQTIVRIVAGRYVETNPPTPPPDSWASDPAHDVAIWLVLMEPRARWTLPPTGSGTRRTLYFFVGEGLSIQSRTIPGRTAVRLRPDVAVELRNGDAAAELLLLQGRPIGEPIIRHGPFVGNTWADIEHAIETYRRTAFGGWPWPTPAPVHARNAGRFSLSPDGRIERPE